LRLRLTRGTALRECGIFTCACGKVQASIFLALSFSCSQAESTPALTQAPRADRGAGPWAPEEHRDKRSPRMLCDRKPLILSKKYKMGKMKPLAASVTM
jgi:hypothetical protein